MARSRLRKRKSGRPRRRKSRRSFGNRKTSTKSKSTLFKIIENPKNIILAYFLARTAEYTYSYLKLPVIKQFSNLNEFDEKFEIVNELGSGAFSSVFKAKNKKTREEVIVKKVTTDIIDKYLLLNNEIRILEKLKNAGCKYTTCYKEYFFGNDCIYMIFDTNSDTNLLEFIKNSRFYGLKISLHDKTKDIIFNQLINGLLFIHNLSIAHNDIKTENIIINSKTKKVKYIDFGFSCDNGLFDYYTCDLPGSIGTPYYMSPEMRNKQFFYTKSFAMKSDIWSLGVTLYQVVYGVDDFLQFTKRNSLVTSSTVTSSAVTSSAVTPSPIDFSQPKYEDSQEKYNKVIKEMLVTDPSKRASLQKLILDFDWLKP